MSDYFYSLEMLLTGRGKKDSPTLGAVDVLALAIADEEREPSPLISFMFRGEGQSNV